MPDKREKTQPWYADGLRFKCTGCGDCCTGAPGYVWVNKAEIEQLANALGFIDVGKFEGKYIRKIGIRKSLVEFPNGDCVFFENGTRRCLVYENRPRQCRTWPFWDSNLDTEARWQETSENCPGCDKGKLYSLEEVDVQRKVMKI